MSNKYLWISRLSFGFSYAALLGALAGGCQSGESDKPTLGPDDGQLRGVPAEQGRAVLPASATRTAPEPAAVADEPVGKRTDSPNEVAPPDSTNPAEVAEGRTPVASPDGPTEEQPPKTSEGLELGRLVVTQSVENREPTALSEVVIGDKPIIAFVEMKNQGDSDAKIVVTFEDESGKSKVGFVELGVPPNKHGWRTWGQTRMIRKAGAWVAVVHGEDGRELGRTAFTVSGG